MRTGLDMLNTHDKDLICEFIYMSLGRVLNTNVKTWDKKIPQGVSVFQAQPDKGSFEYIFTKDDKYPVEKDNMGDIIDLLNKYGNVKAGGIVLYLNKCMLAVASKHKQFSY